MRDVLCLLDDTCPCNQQGEGGSGQWGQRWEQVKLLRAEWTRPKTVQQLFSRVLYISNLKPVWLSAEGTQHLPFAEVCVPVSCRHLC